MGANQEFCLKVPPLCQLLPVKFENSIVSSAEHSWLGVANIPFHPLWLCLLTITISTLIITIKIITVYKNILGFKAYDRIVGLIYY
jgi:hypothetical protein